MPSLLLAVSSPAPVQPASLPMLEHTGSGYLLELLQNSPAPWTWTVTELQCYLVLPWDAENGKGSLKTICYQHSKTLGVRKSMKKNKQKQNKKTPTTPNPNYHNFMI